MRTPLVEQSLSELRVAYPPVLQRFSVEKADYSWDKMASCPTIHRAILVIQVKTAVGRIKSPSPGFSSYSAGARSSVRVLWFDQSLITTFRHKNRMMRQYCAINRVSYEIDRDPVCHIREAAKHWEILSMNASLQATCDRDLLIEKHRSYVLALATEIAKTLPRYVELEELVAYGNLGLIEAAERYNPCYRVSFHTFAWYRIRGAIYDAIRKMGPLSRPEYLRLCRQAAANDVLQTAADGALLRGGAHVRGIENETASINAAIDSLIPVYLLSLDGEDAPDLKDSRSSVLEDLEREELCDLVREMVTELADDDRRVIEEVYFKQRSLVAYASEIGITKSWASRIHARAIKRLRDLMINRGLLKASDLPSTKVSQVRAKASGPRNLRRAETMSENVLADG